MRQTGTAQCEADEDCNVRDRQGLQCVRQTGTAWCDGRQGLQCVKQAGTVVCETDRDCS